jgi:hypothetical protein
MAATMPIEIKIAMYAFNPAATEMAQAAKAPIIRNCPCAKFTSFITPKITFNPVASNMYTHPIATPQIKVKMIVDAVMNMLNFFLIFLN